jgi:hypothetical protein
MSTRNKKNNEKTLFGTQTIPFAMKNLSYHSRDNEAKMQTVE